MEYEIMIKELPVLLPDRHIYGKAYIPVREGRMPAVVLCHAFNSCHADVEDVAKALAQSGVFAYCFDFCGGSPHSRSSGTTLQMSVASELSDLAEVLAFIRKLEGYSFDRLYLYGESQGGFVAGLGAGEGIDGAYLMYPAFCIPDDWRDRNADEMDGGTDCMGMLISGEYRRGLPMFDVFEHISRFSGKVRIWHGTEDDIVRLCYAERAAQSYPDCTLTVFGGEGHGFSREIRDGVIRELCDELSK